MAASSKWSLVVVGSFRKELAILGFGELSVILVDCSYMEVCVLMLQFGKKFFAALDTFLVLSLNSSVFIL